MEVRDRILEVATRRFARAGFEGSSLSRIADEVGIRKPSLLYHFGSKEELHRAVLDGVLARWSEVLPRLLMAAAGGRRFDALVDEMARFFTEDPDRARLIMREMLDRPDAMKARLALEVQPWIDVVASHIRDGREQGEVHADVDPEAYVLEIATLFVAVIAAESSLGAVLPGQSPEERSMERRLAEAKRIAKTSLFVPPRTERAATKKKPAARTPARRTRG